MAPPRKPLWSPGKVAKERGVSRSCAKLACMNGELPCREVLGPAGDVIGYVVRPEDALAWQPRPVGRPRKAQEGPGQRLSPRLDRGSCQSPSPQNRSCWLP